MLRAVSKIEHVRSFPNNHAQTKLNPKPNPKIY